MDSRFPLPMDDQELGAIYEAVFRGRDRRVALAEVEGRHPNTVKRAFNIAAEFERRGLDTIDDSLAEVIAQAAKYGAYASTVKRLFDKWKAWKRNRLDSKPASHADSLRQLLERALERVNGLSDEKMIEGSRKHHDYLELADRANNPVHPVWGGAVFSISLWRLLSPEDETQFNIHWPELAGVLGECQSAGLLLWRVGGLSEEQRDNLSASDKDLAANAPADLIVKRGNALALLREAIQEGEPARRCAYCD